MESLRVTDTKKITTDPVLLEMLKAQGINIDGVQLEQDYARRSRGADCSPYAKLYRDLNSDKLFGVYSGLPMVDAFGQGHELEWRDRNGAIESGNNIFHAVVKQGGVSLVALSPQPGGVKKDAELSFHPQLFIGGSEVKPLSLNPRLLETDPVNGNYHINVLEWDYGVCCRRLRLIEGHFLGSWVFRQCPGKDVLIRYHQSGGFRLKLPHARGADEEFIPADYFKGKTWPVAVNDSITFYPDAHTEDSTVDGYARHIADNTAWPAIISSAGTNAYDEYTTMDIGFASGAASGWWVVQRLIFLFNVSITGAISAATVSLYGAAKADANSAAPDINIYAAGPASNISLTAGDFDSLGSAAFCNSAVTYAGWNVSGYNDFSLNASGIAAIPAAGIAKFGARNANYDVAGTEPPRVNNHQWSYFSAYTAEQGSGYKPKLVVTYTTGEIKTSADSGSGQEAIVIRSQETGDQGSGTETGLVEASIAVGDTGSGHENADISGQAGNYTSGSDEGHGRDTVKMLARRAGQELKIQAHRRQLGLPHKEVNL